MMESYYHFVVKGGPQPKFKNLIISNYLPNHEHHLETRRKEIAEECGVALDKVYYRKEI